MTVIGTDVGTEETTAMITITKGTEIMDTSTMVKSVANIVKVLVS